MSSTRLGETVRQLQLLFSGKSVAGQGDAALLHRFVTNRDEEAFSVLVARHGPLVWAVCRDILRDPRDVEDAFQATFLILVRRARSLWVEESLGGWLYRVSYRVAIRANRDASRYRERERASADLAAFAEPPNENRRAAELHEAIARLPDRYRQPLVLCELEGMPQIQAAQLLRCGDATLRRRLSGAKERLKAQLAHQGVTPLLLNHIHDAALPAGWAETAIRIALATRLASSQATRLADRAVRASLLAKTAKALLILGLVSAAGVTFAISREDDPEPPPSKEKKAGPELRKTAGPVRWVHLKNDNGAEVWANFDTGLEFRRDGKEVSMLDVAKHDLLTYKGVGAIEKSRAFWYGNIKDKFGRQVPPSAFEVGSEWSQEVPYRTPEETRKSRGVFWDYDFDTLNGRRAIRSDQFERDALGETRLHQQVWYDAETKHPLRKRYRYQVAYQVRYKKEFETTDYDYPETGPTTLAALGVPRDAPIIDPEAKRLSSKWVDQPLEVRDAITKQAEAIRKFPRDMRVLSAEFSGTLQLEYWSGDELFVDAWCKTKTSDTQYDNSDKQPRCFRADNQHLGDRPKEIERGFPVDRIVAWFPFDKSINIGMVDGKVNYHLTRFFEGPNKPLRTKVHVLSGGFNDFPKFFERQWPVIEENRRDLLMLRPEPDTPPGMLVIRSNSQLQTGERVDPFPKIFTLDPSHDYIAVRQLQWQRSPDSKTWWKSDVRAKDFKQLANGSWYVSLWEESITYGLELEKPSMNKPQRPSFMRVDVKPLRPDEFPQGIFNGAAFVAEAKKQGATIQTDQ